MRKTGKIGVKVCGMVDKSNILEVARLAPDFMGFIFYPDSPRHLSPDFRIPDALDKTIRRVGVFVNQSVQEILGHSKRHALDYVQLHGTETPEQCKQLKESGVGVIKAFGIDERFDFGSLDGYEPVVDCFLFDTKSKMYGGSGKQFDWNLLSKYSGATQFILSGGIGPSEISLAVTIGIPQLVALDINSAVEVKPGIKDISRVSQVVKKLQEFNASTNLVSR